MVFLYGKSELPYYGKGMGKHKYSKVVDFRMLRRKSIQILGIRLLTSPITEKVWENPKNSQVTSF